MGPDAIVDDQAGLWVRVPTAAYGPSSGPRGSEPSWLALTVLWERRAGEERSSLLLL